MTKPVRLQLSRRKGFDLQAWSREVNGLSAVGVARPSRWGNRYSIRAAREAGYKGDDRALARICVREFRADLHEQTRGPGATLVQEALRHELRGRNLACWCALDAPCHADVLLEWANEAPQ